MWWMVLGLVGFFALMVAVTVYAWRGIDGKVARVDERLASLIEWLDDRQLAREAEAAWREVEAGEPTIPIEDVAAEVEREEKDS